MDISVVIPARNEAENIGSLLESVVAADLGTHSLTEVLVYDDASTDDTAAAAEHVAARHPIIRVIRGATRAGCSGAVERLLEEARSEAIVRLNADVALCDGALKLIVDPLGSGAALAIGAQVPQPARTNVPALAASFAFYVVERLKASRYRRHYAVGHFLAMRRDMVAGVRLPTAVINEDHLLALHIFHQGGEIVHVPGARCLIRPASTFADYWRTSRRVMEGERQLRREYGVEPTPLPALIGAVLTTALRKPLHGVCWAALYAVSSSLPTPTRNSAWDTVRSTKGRIA